MTKLHIKKNDTVLVIAGVDKGKTGKVLSSLPSEGRVVVEGVNISTRHKKPRSAEDKGGKVKAEAKINASNVQLVCPACNKATRVSHKEVDGNMVRVCKKCGAVIDTKYQGKKASKKEAKEVKSKEETTSKKASKKIEAQPKTKPVKDTTKKANKVTKTTSVSKSIRRVASNG